ncbi:MAG: glycosyltransferase family 4 protein [Patescibacteria group bacterium]|jgi:glycosyltransferase involved in cell wall biosynthesis
MKITFIGQKGIPALAGGVERHVEELAVRLAKIPNTEVVAYTRPWYSAKAVTSYDGVRLVSLPSVHTKNFDAITHTFLAIIHAALIERADIIHIQAVGPAILAPLARLLRPKAKVIVTFHCIDRQHQKWGRFAKLMLWLGEFMTMKFAHEVIAVSRTIQHYSYESYGRMVKYIPNGATLHAIVPADKITEQFGLKSKDYVLTVARLVQHKGIHYLIKAFKKLETDKKLVIVGASTFTDDYVQEIITLAADDARIIFTGLQTGPVLQELYSNAYCFALPSESEGLSIALLEAGSYGLPIVASDIPANREVLDGNGLIVPVGNIEALRAALAQLLSDKKLAEGFGEQANRMVLEHYQWDSIVAETFECYTTGSALTYQPAPIH